MEILISIFSGLTALGALMAVVANYKQTKQALDIHKNADTKQEFDEIKSIVTSISLELRERNGRIDEKIKTIFQRVEKLENLPEKINMIESKVSSIQNICSLKHDIK